LWHESKDGRYRGVSSLICEGDNETDSPCGPYSALEKSSDVCYQLQEGESTWHEAEMTCRAKGGHLSAIHDEKVNDFIKDMAVAAGRMGGV
ncbi:hypothetical protein PMAYCL1PPCAC_14439, partial [Pristionchus mayeri]